jgi:hypothetical protein
MPKKYLTSLTIALLVLITLSACGSGEVGDDESSDGVGNSDAIGAISAAHIDRTFTPESFVEAGWKKSKEYDTATVPEASEIWYGFYNQKDIEIRFYANHKIARGVGVPSAEVSIEGAVKRSKGGRLLDVSGGSFTGYADYLVVGNAILLCEFDRTKCDELVANLK